MYESAEENRELSPEPWCSAVRTASSWSTARAPKEQREGGAIGIDQVLGRLETVCGMRTFGTTVAAAARLRVVGRVVLFATGLAVAGL
jgi:hypothetical protein